MHKHLRKEAKNGTTFFLSLHETCVTSDYTPPKKNAVLIEFLNQLHPQTDRHAFIWAWVHPERAESWSFSPDGIVGGQVFTLLDEFLTTAHDLGRLGSSVSDIPTVLRLERATP
jgi:hypothetical protein